MKFALIIFSIRRIKSVTRRSRSHEFWGKSWTFFVWESPPGQYQPYEHMGSLFTFQELIWPQQSLFLGRVPIRYLFWNFGPFSDNFILQVTKICNPLFMIYSWGCAVSTVNCSDVYSGRSLFLVNLVPIFPEQWSLFGPYRDLVGTGLTCGHTAYKYQNCRLEKGCRFWLIFGVTVSSPSTYTYVHTHHVFKYKLHIFVSTHSVYLLKICWFLPMLKPAARPERGSYAIFFYF